MIAKLLMFVCAVILTLYAMMIAYVALARRFSCIEFTSGAYFTREVFWRNDIVLKDPNGDTVLGPHIDDMRVRGEYVEVYAYGSHDKAGHFIYKDRRSGLGVCDDATKTRCWTTIDESGIDTGESRVWHNYSYYVHFDDTVKRRVCWRG